MVLIRGLLLSCLLLSVPLARADFAFTPPPSFADPTRMQLLDITVAGERLVAVGERGLVILSNDQGETWRQASVPVSVTLTAVAFSGADLGWAVGHDGVILHTADGGASWTLQFDGRQANHQYQAYARDEVERLQAVVDALPAGPEREDAEYVLEEAIFALEDADTAVETGPADPFLDVLFLDQRRGYAVGAYGMLYRTADGGDSWQLAISGIENIERYHYYSIDAGPEGRLYLSGEAGLLYHSDDGEHWDKVEGLYEGSFFGVSAVRQYIVVSGLRGNIFRSSDGGESWHPVANESTYSLYGGGLLSDGRLALLGAGGTLLLSSDSGATFLARSHPSRSTFSAALLNRRGDLLVVGMDGLVTFPGDGARE